MLNLTFPTADLRGAEYNPRAIADDALDTLKASITEIGFSKPIIVTRDGLIVAGHQRTRASRALGLEAVPAFVLDTITVYDEVRFNQLHNGTDVDTVDYPVSVPPAPSLLGFAEVVPGDITGNMRSQGAIIRKEIAELIAKYGNWGGAVATEMGEVISGQQYALACKLVGVPARIFYIPNSKGEVARQFFGRQYGKFSYGHLPKTTFLQTFAQMMRLRETDSGKMNRSTLYDEHVLKHVPRGTRILDFGCGQGGYVKKLRADGHDILGIELFYRSGNSIDPGAVHRMIDRVCESIAKRGRFDAVVCDSVLNSVDSLQAEADVMTVCNALAKPGAHVFLSGRVRSRIEALLRMTSSTGRHRYVEFMDDDGFTALFRKGAWFYQKFHSPEQAKSLMEQWIGPVEAYTQTSTSFQMRAHKSVTLAEPLIEAALMREFSMAWPGGKSVGRGAEMVEAFGKSLCN